MKALDPGTHYLCVYLSLWRMQERHDRRSAPVAFANDNTSGWAA